MKRLTKGYLRMVTVAAALSIATGCGSSDGVKLAPVTGIVELDGKPVASAKVEFNPVELPGQTKKGQPVIGGSFAITDEEGNYELHFGTGRPGAVLGEHTVKITTMNVNPDAPDSRRERIPRQYNVVTRLNETVTEGDNVVDFSLTSSPTANR